MTTRPEGRLGRQRRERWLSKRSGERPFFFFVNFLEAHLPYDPPPRYRRRELPDLAGRHDERVRQLERLLLERGLVPRRGGGQVPAAFDADLRARLRALGYVP